MRWVALSAMSALAQSPCQLLCPPAPAAASMASSYNPVVLAGLVSRPADSGSSHLPSDSRKLTRYLHTPHACDYLARGSLYLSRLFAIFRVPCTTDNVSRALRRHVDNACPDRGDPRFQLRIQPSARILGRLCKSSAHGVESPHVRGFTCASISDTAT